jgi:WS/DGAT/MGAT family acyltransferase
MSEWGAGDAMSALEATMWRAEGDPKLRSDGVVVELLVGTPDWDRLVVAHEWAVRRISRLHQRVVEDPLHVGPPAWVDAEVDLAHHLRRESVRDGGTFEDALEIAAAVHMAPFDRERPLWASVLVEGLPDGNSVLVIKIHHAYADGTAVVQLLDLLHSDSSEPTIDPGPRLPLPPADTQGAAEVVARNLRRGITGTPSSLLRALARRPPDVGDAVRYVRSLARVTGDAPGKPSPLLTARGVERHFAAVDLPLAQLRAAGRAGGGTLNDAFLAALAGGYGRYHAERGVAVDDLPMALPVSLRRDDDAAGGNRFAGARIAAPVGEIDPLRRMKIIRERVLAARDEPALDFLGLTAPVMSRAPGAVLSRLTARFTHSIDLQASNFRGLDRIAYVAGCRVERMFPFGPSPGCGLMATLVSHGDRCCIGLNIDTAAVDDPKAMARCIDAGFEEVLELA